MTYSIVARSPATGELGIALQSRYFAAGRHVPWIEAGVGVIASQAFANPLYGHEGLRLLRQGQEPSAVLERLLGDDPGQGQRQVAMLDTQGRVAVHTGAGCVAAAGHAIGTDCCAQANMMARDTVWPAMVRAYESASGEMADRLLAAMDAAELEGGDVRGKQAAALIVVAGKPSGISRFDHTVDLRVDDHPDPVTEIRRLLRYARAHHRANQDDPEFLGRRAVVLLPLGRIQEAQSHAGSEIAREALRKAQAIQPAGNEILLRLADAGVIPMPRQMLEPLLANL